MIDVRMTLGAGVVALCAGVVQAQLFVHQIGEAFLEDFVSERFEDIAPITFESDAPGEIALAGSRTGFASGFRSDGLVVITDTSGVPVRGWRIDFAGSSVEESSAVRQIRFDTDLLVLELTDQDVFGDPRRAVVLRIDEVTGAPVYAWRYFANPDFNKWGMEVRGTEAAFAGAVNVEEGFRRDGLLVRFAVSTGLPTVNNRYQPIDSEQGDLRFNDIAIEPDSGDMYATGAIEVAAKGTPAVSKLVIARFDPTGAVDWMRFYNSFAEGEEFRAAEGWSIEFTGEGGVAVTANTFGDAGDGALAVVVDESTGSPIAGRLIQLQDVLQPAYNSLERTDEGRLLASGIRIQGDGDNSAVMWSMDPSTLSVDWFFQDDTGLGEGADAIVEDDGNLLLAGRTSPFSGEQFSNDSDGLLLRTDGFGRNECSFDDPPEEIEINLEAVTVPVEVIELPEPTPEQPEIIEVVERFQELCETGGGGCFGDFDMDGDVDFGDFGFFVSVFDSMLGDANYDPAADFDMDGDVDFGDFGAFVMNFDRTDC